MRRGYHLAASARRARVHRAYWLVGTAACMRHAVLGCVTRRGRCLSWLWLALAFWARIYESVGRTFESCRAHHPAHDLGSAATAASAFLLPRHRIWGV